jgi:hypothetical protein
MEIGSILSLSPAQHHLVTAEGTQQELTNMNSVADGVLAEKQIGIQPGLAYLLPCSIDSAVGQIFAEALGC